MKMSNIHMELEELAQEKGFESLSEALQAGCEVEYGKDTAELLEPLEAAHRAWEKKKEEVLSIIQSVKEEVINDNGADCVLVEDLETVYDWIEKEAHE